MSNIMAGGQKEVRKKYTHIYIYTVYIEESEFGNVRVQGLFGALLN